MTTRSVDLSPVPATPTPFTTERGLPAPDVTLTQPGVSQPTVVQPPGISGYLPADILLPIVLAVLVVFAASRPGAATAVRALVELFRGAGGPPAP